MGALPSGVWQSHTRRRGQAHENEQVSIVWNPLRELAQQGSGFRRESRTSALMLTGASALSVRTSPSSHRLRKYPELGLVTVMQMHTKHDAEGAPVRGLT